MTRADAERRRRTGHRYAPRQFNDLTRGRFIRARRKRHLARIQGLPTDQQYAMAEAMASCEWSALHSEAIGTLQAMKEAREHRRVLLRVIADFEKSLAKSAPTPPPSSYADLVAARQAS